jgi:hypothetical protein
VVVDWCRLKPEDNYDDNLKRMTSFCELFFNTIIKSIEDCPVFVRHVCEYVQMSAVRKFPDSKQIRQNLSAVGSSSASAAPFARQNSHHGRPSLVSL